MSACSATSRLIHRLMRASEMVRRLVADELQRHELNESRLETLRRLALRGDAGCSQTELARELGIAESTVCGLVDRLQTAGLLLRFRSKSDRRKSLLVLTHAGAALLPQVERTCLAAIEASLANLAESERQQLTKLLDLLVDGRGDAACNEHPPGWRAAG